MVALMQARLKLTTFHRRFERSLRSDIRATFSRPETSLQLAIYTTLSIILVFSSFVMISQTTMPNRVSTRQQNIHGGSGVQQMNVERLYVFLYACMLGLAFSLYRNFIQRWVIQLQVVQQHPLYLVKASVRSHLKTPACWALGTFCVSYLVYILFSGFFYKLATHFVGIFISVLDTPIVGFRWWDVMLFYRMVTIGSSIVSAWIFVDVVMDAYFNRVEDCISPYSNALECLIDGLRLDKENGLRECAFVELARLTAKDPTKRKTIYTTTEGRDTPWSLIKTECFSSMDALTARINQEYNVNKKQEKPKSDAPPTTIKGVKQIKLLNANDTVFSQRRPHATGDALDDRTMHYMVTPPPHYLALSDLPDDELLKAPFQLKLALEDAMLAIKLTFKNNLDDIHVDEKYASSWARLGN
ncbi:hypothetical protein [Absidia glauca]|uniref:Nucleoporin protein Ndc1-Nup n=1 Tax=Absidia glauca TaxID=4829 RepID=A0A163J1B6_ABSGL|nr:hypothetical protein [Absidia glauca]